MILNLQATDAVFASAIDLNKVLTHVFTEQTNTQALDVQTAPSGQIIPMVRYNGLQATLDLEGNNPTFYGKRMHVCSFWADVRGDTKGDGAFPHFLWPKKYLPYEEFVEGIPSKHLGLVLAISEGEGKYTVSDLVGAIKDCARVSGSKLFGVYREEPTHGPNSDRADQTRKVLNMVICADTPADDTTAAIVINLVIVEGKR